MAKSKKKAVWAWVKTPQKTPASALDKTVIEASFQDLLETLRLRHCKAETAENDASLGFYAIEVYFKWHQRFLYICYNQRDAREGVIAPYWEYRIARIQCMSNTTFNLAYFRHTGKWEPIHEGFKIEDTKKAILHDPWFDIM